MSAFLKLSRWIESHRDVAFDLLRMYLGAGLLARGILFLVRPDTFAELVEGTEGALEATTWLMYVVAVVHVVGGAMLAVGFMTRIAALAQIPILIGAVFLIHWQVGLFSAGQSFEFSALVLFLLVLVFLHGSGRWSVDHHRTRTYIPFRKYVDRLDESGNVAFELLRIYLGIGLFVRGMVFISNSGSFVELIGPADGGWLTSVVLIHYVALSHLVGGVMIAIGLFTRAAALVQLPVLIGAVFVVHLQGGLLAPAQSLEFSALVLFLLVLLFLWGSGRLSVDRHILERPEDAEHYRHDTTLTERSSSPAPLLTADATDEVKFGTCSCGHGTDHPRVSKHVRYGGGWGALYFLTGFSGPPKEIVYICDDCGDIIATTRRPELLQQHRTP